MAASEKKRITAAHYFYLLKEEEDGLRRLWRLLGAAERLDAAGAVAGLLADGSVSPSESCSLLHYLPGAPMDLCLAMLPNLAVVEMVQRADEGPVPQAWNAFLEVVISQREHIAGEGVSVFGETTLLVEPPGGEAPGKELLEVTAARVGGQAAADPLLGGPGALVATSAGRVLSSDIDPELAGGGRPRLHRLSAPDPAPWEFYALSAAEPESFVTGDFPELDSLLKELDRAAGYFRQQKDSVVDERTGVDGRVGALLHKQTVYMRDGKPDTSELEESITDLSRMFGLLATDSLMVRRAERHLGHDLNRLRKSLSRIMSGGAGAADEIGDYYLSLYGGDLESIRNVALDLENSRQNAEAAIGVVRTQVELLRAEEEAGIQDQTRRLLGQSLKLQEEGLALQMAAVLIEFVVVFYYVIKSWEGVLGPGTVEELPPLLRMAPVFGIAAGTAIGTHFLARALKSRNWKSPGLWISAMLMVSSIVGLVILSLMLVGTLGGGHWT